MSSVEEFERKVLFTGRGTSGSWKVRGEQLGAALGAVVQPKATADQCRRSDVVVAVKRIGPELLQALRGTRWVWDIVDAYPQPLCGGWTRDEAIRWVQGQIAHMQPYAVLWPNQKMREDCDPGIPGAVLYHHHRPGIQVNTIRPKVQTVAYEGSASYLGGWRSTMEDECSRRGWRFTVNPERLSDADIVVAFRDGPFGGYVQRHWKSNVKLANCHGSGTPFIGQAESGYLETATGAEYWAEDRGALRVAFDWLESQDAREQVRDRFLSCAYPVEKAAEDIAKFLDRL